MPTNVIMPQMGESIAEGTITKWMKKVGEHVDRDEPLFEISTDKVDAEIPSPAAGVLTQILVKENETVAVNTVVAVIDGEGAALAALAPSAVAAPRPDVTRSTALHTPSPAAGSSVPPAAAPPPQIPEGGEEEEIRTSPLVRRIAREHNVDLSEVKGTGLGGRVSKKDILDFIDQRGASVHRPRRRAAAPALARSGSPARGLHGSDADRAHDAHAPANRGTHGDEQAHLRACLHGGGSGNDARGGDARALQSRNSSSAMASN